MTDLAVTDDTGIRTVRFAGQPLTLKMARQLDTTIIDNLQVIGRVNIGGRRKRKKGERLAIGIGKEGTHRAGQLVLATYKQHTFDHRWWVDLSDDDKITICTRVRYSSPTRHLIRYVYDDNNPTGMWLITRHHGITFEIEPKYTQNCEVDHRNGSMDPCTPPWSSPGDLKEYLEAQEQEALTDQALHIAARKSPLVLLP